MIPRSSARLVEAADIPCVLDLGSTGAYLQASYGAAFTGGGQVAVRRKDLERAQEVLAEAWGSQEEDDG